MGILEDFERAHLIEFAKYDTLGPLKVPSIKTPDGRAWRLDEIIIGWQPRISDHWARHLIHTWIVRGDVIVEHVDLPCEMVSSTVNGNLPATDPVRVFIETKFGPGKREELYPLIGRADFCGQGQSDYCLMIEFGTCCPAKFAINLGTVICDHMIVPYYSRYAFVFIVRKQLISNDFKKGR